MSENIESGFIFPEKRQALIFLEKIDATLLDPAPQTLHPAVKKIFSNRRTLQALHPEPVLHTPPSSNVEHYPHKYRWDSDKAAILLSRYGFPEVAALELFDILDGQLPDGQIPGTQNVPGYRENDLEHATHSQPELGTDYGQPPLEALAAAEIVAALAEKDRHDLAKDFIDTSYPRLKKDYGYWFGQRRPSGSQSHLIFNIHPHETGRDSDPTFDGWKFRLPRFGKNTPELVNELNRIFDYFSVIALGNKHYHNDWQIEKIRLDFEVYDVMFNCMYADNLYQMAELAGLKAGLSDDSEGDGYRREQLQWRRLAERTERDILSGMWFPEEGKKGLFLALTPDSPIKEVSVSNLFPLILRGLSQRQLESLLDLIDRCFLDDAVNFPLPSVPPVNPFTGKPNRNYDPHNGERDRLWRGSVWMSMNWYLVERGLAVQAARRDLPPRLAGRCQNLIRCISERSYKLVEATGHAEFHDPEDGRPQRTDKSPNFIWALMAYDLKERYVPGLD